MIDDESTVNDATYIGKSIEELAQACSQLDVSLWGPSNLRNVISGVLNRLFESNIWSDTEADDNRRRKNYDARVHYCIRYALMGSEGSTLPSITLLELLGQENTINRLNDAAAHIRKIIEGSVCAKSMSDSTVVPPDQLFTKSSSEM